MPLSRLLNQSVIRRLKKRNSDCRSKADKLNKCLADNASKEDLINNVLVFW